MGLPREALQKIVVVGSGQVAALAAFALQQALPLAQVSVVVSPSDPAAVADHVDTAQDFTTRWHERLGIDETRLLASAGMSHRLVQRYNGWAGAANSHTPSDAALALGGAWALAHRDMSGSCAGSLAEALARAGRFSPETSFIAPVDYAPRWQGELYLQALVQAAARIGVTHRLGSVAELELDERGEAVAVRLTNGERLEADFFVDATGPRAEVLSQMPQAAWEDWGAALPVRQIAMVRGDKGRAALFDTFALTGAGWVAQTVGPASSQAWLGLAPDSAGGHDAAAAVGLFGREPDSFFDLAPRAQRAPWLGNVLALGDAAAWFEPLGWLNFDLAQRQLDLFLQCLPGKVMLAPERAEYNRRAGLMTERARDYVASHYASAGAQSLFGAAVPSEGLGAMLDQFARRGVMGFVEENPFAIGQWTSLWRALGLADGLSALDRAMDMRTMVSAVEAERAAQEAAVLASPPYAEWLAQASALAAV